MTQHDLTTNAARLDARGRVIETEQPHETACRVGLGVAKKLRIAVDFDGVLFDHVPYLLRGFRDAHGIDLEAEGFRYWDFFQYRAVREADLTWRCVRRILERIHTDHAIHELPPRDPHARAAM